MAPHRSESPRKFPHRFGKNPNQDLLSKVHYIYHRDTSYIPPRSSSRSDLLLLLYNIRQKYFRVLNLPIQAPPLVNSSSQPRGASSAQGHPRTFLSIHPTAKSDKNIRAGKNARLSLAHLDRKSTRLNSSHTQISFSPL